MNRGFDFTVPRLYVLDGGKALHAAVKKYAGPLDPPSRHQFLHSTRPVVRFTTAFPHRTKIQVSAVH